LSLGSFHSFREVRVDFYWFEVDELIKDITLKRQWGVLPKLYYNFIGRI